MEFSAAPNFSHLSTQVIESFSHVATIKNSTYKQVQINIKKSLQHVLPEIKKLDDMYESIYLAFTRGESPDKPEGMQQDLMPYQWRGYKWMEVFYQFGLGGCLADEMGLGKTIQSLALIQAIVNQKKDQGETARILISCPANLIQNWQKEIKVNCPALESQPSVSRTISKETNRLPFA